MELTIEKAYELAVKKWEYIVQNDGDEDGLLTFMPELNEFLGECSYCQMFINSEDLGDRCKGCPLNINGVTCFDDGHVYNTYKWYFGEPKTNAQAVLDLIIKTKPI